MQITAEIRNQKAVEHLLAQLSGKQASQAYAKAMNDAGFQVRRNMQAALRTSFDRVTPWIERSAWVFPAKAEQLSVSVGPRLGKRVGMDPQKILQAQEFGGRRADKRFEVALRDMGLLPIGKQVAIPADRYGGPYPGSDDGRGNFQGMFVRKLLAYLKVNSAALSTMNKRQRNDVLKKYEFKSNLKTRREIKLMDGKEWFVSDGSKRLGAGIWVRDGREMRCAVAFVSAATYSKPRLSMDKIAQQSDLQDYLDKRVRFRIREAAGV